MTAIIALAFAGGVMMSSANAQIGGGGGPPPGGGGGGGGSSGSSGGGHGGIGAGGFVIGCVAGAAISDIVGSVGKGEVQHRQLTPREAWVGAAGGCVPIIGGLILDALLPPDNPCTIAIAKDAWNRYHDSAIYRERVWMERGIPDQTEFNERYYRAYHEPCQSKHVHNKLHKKPTALMHQAAKKVVFRRPKLLS